MRSVVLVLFLILIWCPTYGQYGNSWIDYTQEYYKIDVVKSGVYRLSYDDLNNAGFPVGTVQPKWIQLFHRGVEQAILVTSQQGANVEDYIEFYAEGNDGTLDQELYLTPEDQPHKYYNLYSDTTAYFLTWGIGVSGRRMSSFMKNNVSGLLAETFHLDKSQLINTDQYAPGTSYGDYIQRTVFDTGEGWSGVAKQEGNSIDYTLTEINNSSTDSKPNLEIQFVGRDDKLHQIQLLVGPNASSLRVIKTVNFDQYDSYTLQNEIEWSDISDTGELLVRSQIQGVNGGNDLASVNYIKLTYPQQWDMTDLTKKWFGSKLNSTGESYIEIINTPDNVKILDVTETSSPISIGYNSMDNGISFIVKNSDVERRLFCYSSVQTPSIEKMSFENHNLSEYNYVILSHSSLMQAGGAYPNPIQAYADYRKSNEGGNYNVLVLDVEDVFNQYNYGEFSPLAIRKLLERCVSETEQMVLFIIGKSLLIGTKSGGDYYRKNPDLFEYKDLVPTAGRPGSDLTFGMGLKDDLNKLDIPVGRITASNPSQVAAYLDKVKESEAISLNELWKKDILHLSGGLSTDELVRFENHVNEFKETAEDLYLGGRVTTIRKQSNNTVEFINTTELINNGLNLITFFGHSAPNIVDIDIGYASDPVHGYSNKGKYPIILVNGCSAGQVFGNNYLWGEDWTLTPELGAIGFIAHTYYGYENRLRNYSNLFYSKAFGDSTLIYKPIGRIFQEVISEYRTIYGSSEIHLGQTEQMILVADPAIRLFNAKAPDYAINDESLFFKPYVNGNIDALVDSFAIGVIIKNFGRADVEPIKIRVERSFEDNTTVYYDSIINPVLYEDTVFLTIFNDNDSYIGLNRFKVMIDYEEVIAELSEENNVAEIEAVLNLNGTKNLLPTQYSVVSEQQINLILQSSNVLNDNPRDYIIELDTINTFNSPYKTQFAVTNNVLLNVTIDLLTKDSLVYYWRSKFKDPQVGENEDWNNSSFTYIENGKSGWMQSHYHQVVDDQFNNIQFNDLNGNLSFEEIEIVINLQIYGANHATDNYSSIQFDIDGLSYIYPSRLCRDNAINLVAFSKRTAIPYVGIASSFGNLNSCGRQSQVINNFTFNQIVNSGGISINAGDNMFELYLDTVSEDDYVLFFTTGNVKFDEWSPELIAQIERIGGNSLTIESLSAGEPFILFGQKGAEKGTALEMIASEIPADQQTISFSRTVTGVKSSGSVVSSLIGPAATWGGFKNNIELTESESEKDYAFNIFSINHDGVTSIEFEGVKEKELNLSSIDAKDKPFLKIELELNDSLNHTSSQLDFWQVEYESFPEGVLLLNDVINDDKRILQEGESFHSNFKFVNISESTYSVDSLRVNQFDFNKSFGGAFFQEFNIASPPAGDTTFFSVLTDSKEKVGINSFYIEVNNHLEPEVYYDNNSLTINEYFEVFEERYNPLLQVIFDGKQIVDGSIVSASPIIEISLWDENPFLEIIDTTGIQIFLKNDCEECTYENVNFSSDLVGWEIAKNENRINVQYAPQQFLDGKYMLKILAQDNSGNGSQNKAYEIEFEVINEPSLSNFYIFPNPLTTGARFSYQLTGSVVPDVMEITIMNLSGEVVKFISQEDLGVIRIGNNISEYQWDGKDEFGFELPSGMYIYHFTTFINGKDLVNERTSVDRGFSNGIGKIYIIR